MSAEAAIRRVLQRTLTTEDSSNIVAVSTATVDAADNKELVIASGYSREITHLSINLSDVR